jgi:hypothetical protein
MSSIFELYKKLFPDGHAWNLEQQKIITAIIESKAHQREDWKTAALENLDDIFPNTSTIIDQWARIFGIGETFTEDEKKDQIKEKWFDQGNITRASLQYKIQKAGFINVYVTKNIFQTTDTLAANVTYFGDGETFGDGQTFSKPLLNWYSIDPTRPFTEAGFGVFNFGDSETFGDGETFEIAGNAQVCAEKIIPEQERITYSKFSNREDEWQNYFFVTKSNFPDPITINRADLLRLREVILKNKPANSVAIIITTT